jgi:hypothetical protein
VHAQSHFKRTACGFLAEAAVQVAVDQAQAAMPQSDELREYQVFGEPRQRGDSIDRARAQVIGNASPKGTVNANKCR